MVGYSKDGRYYRFGAEVYPYSANWRGMPMPANRRGSRELGDLTFGLSNNEQKAAVVGVAALGGFFWWKSRKRRRR